MTLLHQSSVIYERMLRGEATTDEYVNALRSEAADTTRRLRDVLGPSAHRNAVADRDRHIRAFNSLEKAVTKHTDDCPDCEDLKRAHRIVMRLLAERTI